MEFIIHLNGSISVELKPAPGLERAVLEEMLARVTMGRKLTLAPAKDSGDSFVIAVEK